jgi:sterol desaturase/sphingolipid hydroxylase (fatty acid hydroxylase superfamily)
VAGVVETVCLLPLLYIAYDLFYSLFHRALHNRSVYRWVHKHHHRQMAPSRG